MGLFGGDSTSINQTRNFYETHTVGAEAGGVSANESTVYVTDNNAFSEAVGLARSNLGEVVSLATDVLGASTGNVSSMLEIVKKSFDLAESSQSKALDTVAKASNNFGTDLQKFASENSTNNDNRLVTMFKWAAGAAFLYGAVKAYKG